MQKQTKKEEIIWSCKIPKSLYDRFWSYKKEENESVVDVLERIIEDTQKCNNIGCTKKGELKHQIQIFGHSLNIFLCKEHEKS